MHQQGFGTKSRKAVITRTASKGFIAASEVTDEDIDPTEQTVCGEFQTLSLKA